MAYHAALSLDPAQPNPGAASTDTTVLLAHTIAGDLAGGDVIEMGVLPAYCTITDAVLFSEGITETATLDVGVMSGKPYSIDDTRTSGAELFDDAAKNATATATLKTLAALTKTNAPRGIGLKLSAAITGGANKKVWLRVTFAA